VKRPERGRPPGRVVRRRWWEWVRLEGRLLRRRWEAALAGRGWPAAALEVLARGADDAVSQTEVAYAEGDEGVRWQRAADIPLWTVSGLYHVGPASRYPPSVHDTVYRTGLSATHTTPRFLHAPCCTQDCALSPHHGEADLWMRLDLVMMIPVTTY
jgi:hypothetical protein